MTTPDTSPRLFHCGDVVRVTSETAEAPSGAVGRIIGFYTCDPPTILVDLAIGGPAQLPASALEPAT